MELYTKLNFKFDYFDTHLIHLKEDEWRMMIQNFCVKLAEKPIGKLLLNKLTQFISNRYHIKFANYDTEFESSYIYPKIIYIGPKHVVIVIPSVPYFVNVDVLNESVLQLSTDHNLHQVINCKPTYSKLDLSFTYNKNQKSWFLSERLPQFIGFAHELVHCLRHFEGIDTNHLDEEERTIYGISYNTLSYEMDGQRVYVTENSIRKDFGLKPRISHSSDEVFCWRVASTYDNSRKFTKDDFFI